MLYIIVCGSPAARGVAAFVTDTQVDGWRACIVPTPMGASFVDRQELERLTGFPVRTTYKHPDEPDVLPPADAFVVAPATFNTVNKIAGGISDTLAVGLICEGLGLGRPVIIVPWFNRALTCHGAYRRSLDALRTDRARLVLTDQTQPGGDLGSGEEPTFPWPLLRDELAKVRLVLSLGAEYAAEPHPRP